MRRCVVRAGASAPRPHHLSHLLRSWLPCAFGSGVLAAITSPAAAEQAGEAGVEDRVFTGIRGGAAMGCMIRAIQSERWGLGAKGVREGRGLGRAGRSGGDDLLVKQGTEDRGVPKVVVRAPWWSSLPAWPMHPVAFRHRSSGHNAANHMSGSCPALGSFEHRRHREAVPHTHKMARDRLRELLRTAEGGGGDGDAARYQPLYTSTAALYRIGNLRECGAREEGAQRSAPRQRTARRSHQRQ